MNAIPTDAINELNFRRRVRRLHRLGPRPIGELLLELAEVSGRRTWLDMKLVEYGDINGATLDALGASDWPRPILHLAARGRP
jgi:hypothetical protein